MEYFSGSFAFIANHRGTPLQSHLVPKTYFTFDLSPFFNVFAWPFPFTVCSKAPLVSKSNKEKTIPKQLPLAHKAIGTAVAMTRGSFYYSNAVEHIFYCVPGKHYAAMCC